jgi:hypothetical protein
MADVAEPALTEPERNALTTRQPAPRTIGTGPGALREQGRAWHFTRMDEAVPLPRTREEHGARRFGRPWAVVGVADRGPSLEPACRGVRIDPRAAVKDAVVLLVVGEAVDEGVSDLARVGEVAAVVDQVCGVADRPDTTGQRTSAGRARGAGGSASGRF